MCPPAAIRPEPDASRRRLARWLVAPWLLALGGGGQATEADTLTLRTWPARRPVPALTLPSWEGPPWSLAAHRGQPVLLNFWASWCEPCRAEMPSLELLATRHEAQGLQVLAVNFRETDAAVRRYIEASAFSLPVLRDRDGGAAAAFGVRTFPSTVGINRQGQVLSIAVGECDWTGPAARRWVAALL
jgi:thiol-disulfide isomerase/thioredoxin